MTRQKFWHLLSLLSTHYHGKEMQIGTLATKHQTSLVLMSDVAKLELDKDHPLRRFLRCSKGFVLQVLLNKVFYTSHRANVEVVRAKYCRWLVKWQNRDSSPKGGRFHAST